MRYTPRVNDPVEPYTSKARECLAGAASELANGRYNNAANRAYYAAYNAAIVALLRAGFSSRSGRWNHAEVQSLFAAELVARRKLYSRRLQRMLYDLVDKRARADYGHQTVNAHVARSSVEDAVEFVLHTLGTP